MKLRSPWGRVRVRRETPQLTAVDADNERAAAFGQGWVAGRLRRWQLELQRRVASGTCAELFGAVALASDRFQRDLGLVALAQREAARDADSAQAELVQAYVAGVNRGAGRAIEFWLLRHKPRAFEVLDVYLVAQLKYFINSTWRFELLHTLMTDAVGPERAAQWLSTPVCEGGYRAPLPLEPHGGLTAEASAALVAGAEGLQLLGLDSPDIGSNAFAVSGRYTESGAPLLASDPHMGLVNPAFHLLFRITAGDGLAVMGAHFPGCPGIVVGRNRHVAWGMVGLMADNQDLLWGVLDSQHKRVRVAGAWVPLVTETSTIGVRGGQSVRHVARGFSGGRLIHHRGTVGLFLRWPALDQPLGSIALTGLARARDGASFRRGLGAMHNAPMIAVYADRRGDVGLQAVGLIPRRAAAVGSVLQSLDREESQWQGYVPHESLPSVHGGDEVVYANQYEAELFDSAPHLSNRWHPPARAQRIRELLAARARHTPESFAGIQDDRVDGFARRALPLLREWTTDGSVMAGWDGDTRQTRPALLFERWMDELTRTVVGRELPVELAAAYADQWPAHRWNVLNVLSAMESDRTQLVDRALEHAARARGKPRVAFRHSLRRHPIGRILFAAGHNYDGGSRETIHVARRNVDFLTARQAEANAPVSPYSFGPAFKFVFDLSARGRVLYSSNLPARGLALPLAVAPAIRRWRNGRRYFTHFR